MSANAVSQLGLHRLESPVCGTFYRASPPVEVGDTVVAGHTVCILEVLMLMIEVKSEIAGIVRAIHGVNGKPVKLGQLLFELEPVQRPDRPAGTTTVAS